jgi:predicted transcriptional regulator
MVVMEQEELDRVLQVIENPVRRRIIKRLSQEPCYALQLSKELGLGQPLVAKHLVVMEEAGLVTSISEISPAGPPRKKYSLARGISITLDVGPNVFMEKGAAFEARSKRQASQQAGLLRKRYHAAVEAREDRTRLSLFSDLLGEVDKRMEELEEEREELLDVRNRTMSEAAQIVSKLDRLDMRRVLFHILDEHDREVESISEALNLREVSVREILEELERDYFE